MQLNSLYSAYAAQDDVILKELTHHLQMAQGCLLVIHDQYPSIAVHTLITMQDVSLQIIKQLMAEKETKCNTATISTD